MTFWSAPASALAEEQLAPSLLPCQPPNDGTMSPPAERIWLIAVWSTPPGSGRRPSQAGWHPPESSPNAIVNHLMPVEFITVVGLGGSPQPSNRYGAACLKPVPPPLPASV